MLRGFPDYLNQPFEVKTTRRGRVTCVAILLVLFVLGVFQPFGIADVEGRRKIVILGLSAAGTGAGLSLILYLFPRLFPRYYACERWTVGKNMLNQLGIVLAVGCCVGGLLVLWTTWSLGHAPAHAFRMFGELLLAVGIVSPIPLAVTAVMVRNQHLQSHLQEMEEMNRYLSLLSEAPAPAAPDEPLPGRETASPAPTSRDAVLLAGSTKDSLLLPPETLLYLEACGNYVKIFYEAEGKPKQKLLRTTIKQMEDALRPYPFMLRCHRAFLVNTGQVVRIQGNSQGYRLQFRQTEEEVPVSRAYTGVVREKFR